TAAYASMDPAQAAAAIKKLEARMYKHAQNLEFEDAAKLRDEIHQLREQSLR
ncbi:UvrB/UvrC motif-containing protein, partial [Rhodanobacter sp. 115]